MSDGPGRPLWRCRTCGRRFANQRQTHACGRYTLASHFAGKPRAIRLLFDALRAAVRRCGPVVILPEKTRIAFQVRMSFAQLTPRSRWLDHFRLHPVRDVDAVVEAWLREAYAVGEQRHLAPKAVRCWSMLAVLLGRGLRRGERLALDLASVQQREEHWVIAGLIGKGGHVRTVPMPTWVKAAMDAWASVAGIFDGAVFRAIDRRGRV